jgi:hypothetical protein
LFELPGATPPDFAPVKSHDGLVGPHGSSVAYVYASIQTSVMRKSCLSKPLPDTKKAQNLAKLLP